jgi:glucoamylase
VADATLAGTKFHKARCLAAASDPALLATDLADWLVRKGMPFRGRHIEFIIDSVMDVISKAEPEEIQVIATAEKLREVFQELYSVNRTPGLGTAIGRYPEDVYDGLTVGDHPGNPWVLATLAYAEFNYRVAQEWSARGRVEFTELNLPYLRNVLGDSLSTKGPLRAGMHLERGQAEFDLLLERIREKGDSFLDRMKYHTPESGSLSEQFSQVSGFMQGARDLGWSYVSFLTAVTERTHLLGH